jgi:nicotinamidase-related amidase
MNLLECQPASDVPIMVFVDLQAFHCAEERVHFANIEQCLFNCRTLLTESRKLGLPIAHFRLKRSSTDFSAASRPLRWIDELRPKPSEMIFDHSLPSCYSNRQFCAFVDAIEAPTLVLAGLTGERTCLSTAVEAFHRGHLAMFVADASASRALSGLTPDATHTAIAKLVSLYGEVLSTQDLLRRVAHVKVS